MAEMIVSLGFIKLVNNFTQKILIQSEISNFNKNNVQYHPQPFKKKIYLLKNFNPVSEFLFSKPL